MFEEQLQKIFSYILFLNNAELIKSFSHRLRDSQFDCGRSSHESKIKDELGSEQKIIFVLGQNPELFGYLSYNYRKKFHKYLCQATKDDIEKGKIETLKLLVTMGALDLSSRWEYKPQSSSSGSKPVTDYLALQECMLSYWKEDLSLDDAKKILSRMNLGDAQHLLSLHAQGKTTASLMAARLLSYLKSTVSVRGATTVPNAPPLVRDEKEQKKEEQKNIPAAEFKKPVELSGTPADLPPPAYNESLSHPVVSIEPQEKEGVPSVLVPQGISAAVEPEAKKSDTPITLVDSMVTPVPDQVVAKLSEKQEEKAEREEKEDAPVSKQLVLVQEVPSPAVAAVEPKSNSDAVIVTVENTVTPAQDQPLVNTTHEESKHTDSKGESTTAKMMSVFADMMRCTGQASEENNTDTARAVADILCCILSDHRNALRLEVIKDCSSVTLQSFC